MTDQIKQKKRWYVVRAYSGFENYIKKMADGGGQLNILEAGCGRFWHPLENRALTLREAARIQGFPDSFVFLDQSRESAKLVGNALDYPFASMCYRMIREALE